MACVLLHCSACFGLFREVDRASMVSVSTVEVPSKPSSACSFLHSRWPLPRAVTGGVCALLLVLNQPLLCFFSGAFEFWKCALAVSGHMTSLTRSHHTVYVKFCVNQIGFQIVGVPAKRGWKLRLFGRWSCLGSPAVRSTRERWCRPAPPACFAQSRLSPHPKLSSTSHGSWHAAVVEPPSSSEGRLRCVHRCSGTHLPWCHTSSSSCGSNNITLNRHMR